MSRHTCHAHGCETPIRPVLLMCGRHWRMVPRRIQLAVYRTYRPGQCDDKRPSKEWHEAASAAIGYVALVEGRGNVRSEVRALVAMGFRDEYVERKTKELGEGNRERIEAIVSDLTKPEEPAP